jgi:predicted nucleic acid-binding protein
VKIAADANALLSAVIGGRARLVLDHPVIEEVFTTEATFEEVREYAILLGRKKKLAPDTILLTVAALPVTIIRPEIYAGAMVEARRRIEGRDPDDVEILALALHLRVPLWSNDNDFEDCGIERLTTAEILSKLGIFDAR